MSIGSPAGNRVERSFQLTALGEQVLGRCWPAAAVRYARRMQPFENRGSGNVTFPAATLKGRSRPSPEVRRQKFSRREWPVSGYNGRRWTPQAQRGIP